MSAGCWVGSLAWPTVVVPLLQVKCRPALTGEQHGHSSATAYGPGLCKTPWLGRSSPVENPVFACGSRGAGGPLSQLTWPERLNSYQLSGLQPPFPVLLLSHRTRTRRPYSLGAKVPPQPSGSESELRPAKRMAQRSSQWLSARATRDAEQQDALSPRRHAGRCLIQCNLPLDLL
jgi:hypothetical protein